ncbi:hypothetical protein D3C73_1247200 [compost metagenome]
MTTATISPTLARDALTSRLPNQRMKMTQTFITNNNTGMVSSIQRLALTVRFINSPLVSVKRSTSWRERTSARIQRIPVKLSRMTAFVPSSFSWTLRKSPKPLRMTVTMAATKSGVTRMSAKDTRNWRVNARARPPSIMSGARSMTRRPMKTMF